MKTVDAGGRTYAVAWGNALVVFAAILFLIRIVVDNVLYYNDPDARTTKPAYAARVALIFIDLTSYAVCYHMVAVIEPSAGKTAPFAIGIARTVAADIALVELLHLAWCVVAILLLPVSTSEQEDRLPLLKRWAWLSGTFAAISFGAWILLDHVTSSFVGAALVFTVSLASAITYMVAMRDQQYLGPTTAWARDTNTRTSYPAGE